jgi:uncharacterized metal-binding protein YceD (DUF177 family)
MKIHLRQIPAEGLRLEGTEDGEFLDIHDPGVGPASPVRYSLDVGLSDGGLFASGTLETDVQLRCVRCLETFTYPLVVPHFAVQVELTGQETVDLTPFMREDTLLSLPAHPRCDWSGKICSGAGEWHAGTTSEQEAAPDAWEALDKLKVKTSE